MTTIVSDDDYRSPVPTMPELAKTPAVNRLADALVARGLHEHTAHTVAYAACDPSAARRQLEQPAEIRVSGGVLEVLHTRVWVPAILPYPENPRMLPSLTYAVEERPDRRPPLTPARAGEDPKSPELVMPAVASPDLVGYLDVQLRYLRANNDLTASVGNHGILQELLLVPMTFETTTVDNQYTNGLVDTPRDPHQGWDTALVAVDGNSRLSAAYRHLRLDPSEYVTRLMGSPRALRQRIGTTLAMQNTDDLTQEGAAALRSLTAPAAIVVGYRPEDDESTIADAIQSRLGALHVAPAKEWSPASRYDLLLNVSLDSMQGWFDDWARGASYTGDDYRRWLAGELDADQAVEVGLDSHPDLRAAALWWCLHDRDSRVSKAIRKLDVVGNVTPQVRANIAAEGALRSFRSDLTNTEADNARRVLAALWDLDDIRGEWNTNDTAGIGPLTKVRSAATAEIVAAGRPGPMARLLMVVAFYWVARHRLVAFQTRGGMTDRRKLTDVVTQMCRTEHGVRQLAQITTDGRRGRTPRRVDEHGDVIVGENGKDLPFNEEWMRSQWPKDVPPRPVTSPEADLANRQDQLVTAVDDVTTALLNLAEPMAGDNTPLVESVGMELDQANHILTALEAISQTVLEYRFIAKRASL